MPQEAIRKVPLKRSSRTKKQPPRQDRAKPAKKPRTTIPLPQVERIRQRYISGQSIRKIAREEKRDQETVARIVKGPEIQSYVHNLREKYYGLGETALEALSRGLKNSKDGRLAVELLRSIGVIPSAEEAHTVARPVQVVAPMTEEEEVKAQMWKLVNVAYERAKVFNMPMPSLDDVELEPERKALCVSEDNR